MSDMVRLEYTGTNTGPISFSGANRLRQYRGADNVSDKYVDAEPEDVETLIATGRWRKVDAKAAQDEGDQQTAEQQQRELEEAQLRQAAEDKQRLAAARDLLTANEQATAEHNLDNAAAALAHEQAVLAEQTGATTPAGAAAGDTSSTDAPRQYSTAEAAEALGLPSADEVRELIEAGELQATKDGNRWVISQAEIDAYRATRDQA